MIRPSSDRALAPPVTQSGRPPDRAVEPTADPLAPIRVALEAIRATGAGTGEALAMAADGLGWATIAPLVVEALRDEAFRVDPAPAVDLLTLIAKGNPALARMAYDEWGRGREVGGILDLRGRSWGWPLPEGMVVTGHLYLDGLPITAFPAGVFRGQDLYLKRCPIRDLPEGLTVGGDLNLVGCPLMFLPAGLRIMGSLWLDGSSVTMLPPGLVVEGELTLSGCSQLRSLADGLTIGEDLNLYGCSLWNGWVPGDARIGGKLFTTGHSNGVSLRAWRNLDPQEAR